MDYKAQVIKELNEEVILTSRKFWSACHDAQLLVDDLKELLPRLIPMLFSDMVYADDDQRLLDTKEDESRRERNEVHDDDSFYIKNLREKSAKTIQILSKEFGEEVSIILLPLIKANLLNFDDEAWKEREAAILAFGSIAEGCVSWLHPLLFEIVGSLVPLLEDTCPFIRSTSCWTLCQFGMYFFEDDDEESYELFTKVLMCFLRKLLDTNDQVQEAACLALITFEECADEDDLVPHLDVILQHLMSAFVMYQQNGNSKFVYNAIDTLVESVREELNKIVYLEVLMPPLTAKFQLLSNSDKELFPLLKCLTSISQVSGVGYTEFGQPIVQKSLDIIQLQQLAKVDPTSAGVQYDKELILCSLELLSRIGVDRVGNGIMTLSLQSNLKSMLCNCCMDESSDVSLSAFALISDLAIDFPVNLQSHLFEFLEMASHELRESFTRNNRPAANNACKAIRECAVKFREEVTPFMTDIVTSLSVILQHDEALVEKSMTTPVTYNELTLAVNSAITLGLLALIRPDLVAPHMEDFMKPWCKTLSRLSDDTKKEDALRGLCSVVKENPSGGVSSVHYICLAFASWKDVTNNIQIKEHSEVLHGYKFMLGAKSWEKCLSYLDARVKERLARYQV